MIARLLRSLSRKRDEELFYTHTGWAYEPGRRIERDGRWYVITRIKRTSDTLLFPGGSAPCWIIYGRPA